MKAKVVHMTSVHVIVDPRIARKECATLAAAGYDVTLVAAHNGSTASSPIPVVAVPRPASRATRMTWTAFRVFLAALRQRADVYHIHDPELLPWGQVLRLLGKRVIFDMHENHAVDTSTKDWTSPILGRFMAWLYNRAQPLLMAGMPVVFAEDSYQPHYPRISRSVAVRNLPLLTELLGIREQKNTTFTIVYFGRVSRDRGSLVTLRAMRFLKDRGHDVAFDCLGLVDDADRDEVLRLAEELRLEKVSVPGFIEPGAGWRRVARGHVGLAVLRARPNYVNSYPTKLFDYMALGMPVIVSDFPLYKSVISTPECGFAVDPEDPVALADAIERLIRDPELATRLGENGRMAAQQRYSWAGEGEKLLRFYDELLAS